jgi:hypothetical protein
VHCYKNREEVMFRIGKDGKVIRKRKATPRELIDIGPPTWPFPFSSRGWHLRIPTTLARVGGQNALNEKGRG